MSDPVFIVSFGFVILCAYMARHAVLGFKRANESHHWPTAEGVLTDVSLWGKRRVDGEMIDSENLSVSYEYAVDGVQYSGREVAFFQLHYPETVEFARSNPRGSRVKVFYNPTNFEESVLVSGPHPTKPHAGLILAVLGVLVSSAVSVGAWMGVLE